MDIILEGLRHGLWLLLTLNREVLAIAGLSLAVSASAVLLGSAVGLPLGSVLAFARFPGRRPLIGLVNTGMGLPPVVVGLVVALLLWRSGPLGFLDILFTPWAMILAQTLIATPIVAGLSLAALESLDPRLRLQLLGLGASRLQAAALCYWEARGAVLAALMASFGRVMAEVGAVMMVGGNIRGQTRVLTTATVLEARIGNFEVAIALGLILLILAFLINWGLTALQQRRMIW
jgi:ABC-type tungstate transport system substrate-binding protein